MKIILLWEDDVFKMLSLGHQVNQAHHWGISGLQDGIASVFLKESYLPKFLGGLVHIFLPKKMKVGLA